MTWQFIQDIWCNKDENDLEYAIVVFRVGTHINKEEGDRSDHIGT